MQYTKCYKCFVFFLFTTINYIDRLRFNDDDNDYKKGMSQRCHSVRMSLLFIGKVSSPSH